MSNPTGKGGFGERPSQINRKGRPRDFQKLRDLARMLGNEQAGIVKDGIKVPIVIDDGDGKSHIATQVEMILREMMHSNPERYLEIAYGKVPQNIDITSQGEKILSNERYDRAILNLADAIREVVPGTGAEKNGDVDTAK